MTVDSLGLPIKSEKSKCDSTKSDDDKSVIMEETIIRNNINLAHSEKLDHMVGHGLNDQPIGYIPKQNSTMPAAQLNSIRKFDGQVDVEQWLKEVLEKFDSTHLSPYERNSLIPDILTGEALIWYLKQQHHMPTFNSFIQSLLHQYGTKNPHQDYLPLFTSFSKQTTQETIGDYKETIMESFRHQMLINSLEKLPKFSGKSNQKVSKWLHEIQQAMHIFKLADNEKLFLISTCLEADTRDWFFDNSYLFTTWTTFTQKLIKTFESTGRADISFNRLRHYQQGLTQDVRKYYFEIMKLCKEANPSMDDASKLQYLKDGLKSSLRFDVLIRNPQTTEEFLEYAQKVGELKSLDEKDSIIDQIADQKSAETLTLMSRNKTSNPLRLNQQTSALQHGSNNLYKRNLLNNNTTTQPVQQHTIATATNDSRPTMPQQPYKCYNCGEDGHFIRNCPYFQGWSH